MLLEYEDLFHKDLRMKHCLSLMYKDILDFHKRAKRFFQTKSALRIFFSLSTVSAY